MFSRDRKIIVEGLISLSPRDGACGVKKTLTVITSVDVLNSLSSSKDVWKFMQESRPHSVNMATAERDRTELRRTCYRSGLILHNS